jgi:hypothetical protein
VERVKKLGRVIELSGRRFVLIGSVEGWTLGGLRILIFHYKVIGNGGYISLEKEGLLYIELVR